MGLSALVVIDNESHMVGGSIRYLTNFFSSLPPRIGALIVTPTGATLSVSPGFRGSTFRLASQTAQVKDVIGTRSGLWGHDLAQDIWKALDKAKVVGRVGIDGLNVVTQPLATSIRAALSSFELIEQTGIVEKLRMFKSPAEWESIREAVRLADIGITALRKAVKADGLVDLSIAEQEYAAKVQGAEAASVFMGTGMGTGNPWIWGTYHGLQVYKEGDMVSAELNAKFQGYYGQVCRSFVIGKASAKQKHAYNAAMEAYQKEASMIRPGAIASEIHAAGNEVIKKAGLEPLLMRSGHGMGLTIAEGFDIYEGDNTEIQPESYVMIHPVAPLEEGVVILGNCFRVTETGCEELGKAEFHLEI